MKKYEFLLFDADATLLDFNKTERHAMEKTFKSNGYILTDEIYNVYHKINKSLWKKVETGELSRDQILIERFDMLFDYMKISADNKAWEDTYQELLGSFPFLIKDAYEVIENLGKKYRLFIVSNGVGKTQMRRIRESKMEKFFEKIFISGEIGFAKPQKEFFDISFSQIKDFDKDKAIIIGDSLTSDIRGGNNAGIDTCWFNINKVKKDIDVKIDYEVSSLKQLETLF